MASVPSPLIDAFREQRAAVFAGAGVSLSAGLPLWNKLLEPLRNEITDCPKEATPLDLAQYYVNQEGPVPLVNHLRRELDKEGLQPTDLHRALVSLPINRIYTTNFDDLLERAYESEKNRKALKVTRSTNLGLTSGRLSVVKLHGDLEDAESIVLTAEDFEEYFESHTALAQQISYDLSQRTVLFIGYSFSDPDMRNMLRQARRLMGKLPQTHYIVQINPSETVVRELERRGLRVIKLDGRPGYSESVLAWLQRVHQGLKRQESKTPGADERARLNHNLPPEAAELVGRSKPIAALHDALTNNRMVLLVGPPGIGKTALALKVAHELALRRDPEGFEYVVWVTAREGSGVHLWLNEVLNAIGLTLEFPKIAQMPASDIDKKRGKVDLLLEHRRILIVLDNLEAMNDLTLRQWARTVPLPSKVLMTSRVEEPHASGGVRVLKVAGLDTQAAVALLERFASSRDGAEFPGEKPALRIAEVTGGNPQAMRLALGVLRNDKLKFEEAATTLGKLRDSPEALFDQLLQWSWDMLSFAGRQILLITVLFPAAGSMTIESIEASVGLSHSEFTDALAQVVQLGLLTDAGQGRFAIHPMTRQFALDKLPTWEKFADDARERCAKYYVAFVRDRIVRSQPPVSYWNVLVTDNMKLIDREWPILNELMNWAKKCERGDLFVEFVLLLTHYLDSRFLNAERLDNVKSAVDSFARNLGLGIEALLRIDALGWTYVEESRMEEAHEQIDQGLRLAERLNDRDLVALAHAWRGRALIEEGKKAEADSEVKLALENAILCSAWIRVRIYMAAGDMAHKQGRYEDALSYFERSFNSAEEYGGEGGGYQIYPRIGMALMNQGRVREAEEKFQAVHDLQGIPIGNLYGEYGLALVAFSRYQSVDAKARVQRALKELEDRTSSNLLLKLLRDFQKQLQTAGTAVMNS